MAEATVVLADSNPPEHAPKTRLQIESRRWLASRYDPETYGEKLAPAVSITINSMHLDSLRRRASVTIDNPQLIDNEPLLD
jgi:DNA-binding transcriptional ArsR family regulator